MSDFDPKAFIAGDASMAPIASTPPAPEVQAPAMELDSEAFDPQAFIREGQQEKYGSPGQQAITALEGIGEGLVGPLAPAAERILGVDPQEILARKEANPWAHGIGQAIGLTGGFLTGTGEAAVMTKAGKLATEAAGLGKVAEAANMAREASVLSKAGAPLAAAEVAAKAAQAEKAIGYGYRVGESAVAQAAEMAVLATGDEISKRILQDPNTSAESAIANIGLSMALGAGGGAFITGAVSPLWKATVGNKVEGLLTGLRDHMNGSGAVLPEKLQQAANKLGIEQMPEGFANKNFSPAIRDTADVYMQMKGAKAPTNPTIVEVDVPRATSIAQAYDQMPHNPGDPRVKRAYDALINETNEQYQLLKQNGLKVSKITDGVNPYKNSQEMIADIRDNNHLWYFPTEAGFGSATGEVKYPGHPLLQLTKELDADGNPMPANDIFRIVHDYFGHAKEGVSFGARGEENAWRQHMPMYSPEAQKALTTETRGQNSWVNFGPKAAHNRANPANTIYADQKAGLLPDWALKQTDAVPLQIDPTVRAALSNQPKALESFNILREGQNPEVLKAIDALHRDAGHSVMSAMNLHPEDVLTYSENEAGHNLLNAFKTEYAKKYGPIAAKLDARDAEAALLSISDDARLSSYGKLMEKAMNVGTDSPYYNLYPEYGNRMLAKETIGELDKLTSEINNRMRGMQNDYNVTNALREIRDHIADFKESEIALAGKLSEREGIEGAKRAASTLINERADVARQYAEFAKMSNELMSNLGIGKFSGEGGLRAKLTEGLTAEEVLRKFSIKGNADFTKFLAQHFPETLQAVQQNELKKFIKPAILSAKGEAPLNIAKLHDIVEKAMAGQKEYVQSVLSPQALERIMAAKELVDSIPNPKSSGTAGWMTKMFKDLPRSAMAGVAMLTGHNPILGAILGEGSQLLGRNAPDAMRLAYLKYLGSNQPIKAEGFKSMVEFFNATYKGENAINKAIQNLMKGPSQVVAAAEIPTDKDRENLDKQLDKLQGDPRGMMMAQSKGDVGHYLPDHQAALSQTAMTAAQYLQNLRPKPYQAGPLDKPIAPSAEEIARYERAQDIAISPTTVLQHIKNGTLQVSDITDLNSMYPGLYKLMQTKIMNQIVDAQANEEPIPYKTRVSMSLFLQQPLDSSMNPASILAAQPKETRRGPAMAPPKQKGSPSKLNMKNTTLNQTPTQQAERDRAARD